MDKISNKTLEDILQLFKEIEPILQHIESRGNTNHPAYDYWLTLANIQELLEEQLEQLDAQTIDIYRKLYTEKVMIDGYFAYCPRITPGRCSCRALALEELGIRLEDFKVAKDKIYKALKKVINEELKNRRIENTKV